MLEKKLPYDKTSPDSILAYARLLLGKSLHDLYPQATIGSGKGSLGQCIEYYHFQYAPNSKSAADFSDAGLELKCTPLKTVSDGSMVSKERLVLNIINYIEEYDATFETSSFMRKNALLLLMFYLYRQGVSQLDLIFRIIRLWKIPEEDLKIFMDDWNVIHNKIVHGLAHEISEGDTLYLSACIKGTKGGANKKKQKGSNILADQRAYSIKSSYLNQVIIESLLDPEMCSGVRMTLRTAGNIIKKKTQIRNVGRIVKSVREYKRGETFEQLVLRKFKPFIGLSVAKISKKLRTKVSSSPKAISYSVCRAILGVKEQKISEFEKAGLALKTIRLEENGRLKEAMSFQTIKYQTIINEEEWSDSDWYNTIVARRFFFVIFRKKKNGKDEDAILESVFFWAMPTVDIVRAKELWLDTRSKVRIGDYSHFIKSSENDVCHIRPKAQNAADVTKTPQGGFAKKYCWWLNRDYILKIVNQHLSNKED